MIVPCSHQSPIHTRSEKHNSWTFISGRCGAPLFGALLRVRDWPEAGYFATDKPHPRGELLVGGRGVAPGYFKRPQETSETFFEEHGVRWLATGDIGEIFPDGSVMIIDRKYVDSRLSRT